MDLEKLAYEAAEETLREMGVDSPSEDQLGEAMTTATREQLRAFVARIEKREEEKAEIAADIKEIYAEAKSMGYDTNVLRKVISLRKQDSHERQEMEALLELYLGAVGEH